MRIELKCAACGSNNFELGDADTDNSVITCGECGHVVGTMGELKSKLAEEVIRHSRIRRDLTSAPTSS
jgi:uncharacterized Zn finger protein